MQVVDVAHAAAGDALRSVAEYREADYELYFVRDDLDLAVIDVDEIHQNLVLDGMGREYLEELFDAGDLQCTMHQFDEAQMFHFVFPHNGGLFVSVGADGDVPVRDLVDGCKRWYDAGRPGSEFP